MEILKVIEENFLVVRRLPFETETLFNYREGDEERYKKLLANIEDKSVFERSEEKIWICRNCGHIYVGNKAPEICPVCSHPKAFFELRSTNY